MVIEITIEGRKIGDHHPCYVIAEAGLNHDGDVDQAKELVTSAKEVGADMVKFQIYQTPELCSRSSKSYDLFSSLELSREEWIEVATHAKHAGITFSASVFGEYGLGLLAEMGCGSIKIASSDLTYGQLLGAAAKTGMPLVVSTGMSYLGEIEEALRIIRVNGNPDVALLHCVSNYPTSVEDANLRAMSTMLEAFHVPDGFSDHTLGDLVPLAAVALGASLIEKHFTLDRGLPGPDHKLSMIPEEFATMIQNIRNVEKALGSGLKVPVEKEQLVRKSARRSIVTKHELKAGSIITKEDVQVARPGSGLEPAMLDKVLGRKAVRNLPAGTILTWDDI